MLILIVFIVGLILLLMPLLHPLAVLLQQFFTLFVSGGIRAYSHLTLRNNRRKTLNMQLSLLFGYALILFIETIASSQSAMAHYQSQITIMDLHSQSFLQRILFQRLNHSFHNVKVIQLQVDFDSLGYQSR